MSKPFTLNQIVKILQIIQSETNQNRVYFICVDENDLEIQLEHELSESFRIPFLMIEGLCNVLKEHGIETIQYRFRKSCCSSGLSDHDNDYIDEKYVNASDDEIEEQLNLALGV